MAKPIIIPVKADERMLSSSIERGASGAFRKLGSSAGAVAPLGRMMGKIRSDADEFTKSIEASNARVIAFGASVGVINGISNAFKKLVETTVRVEKVLTDVNVVLNTSSAGLQKFGEGLFKVAKNTAQSFDVVAEAALEFSRQGLSVEETLRRTNDALILTRLTGLKAADSVKGLTAAVNGFAKAGLTTTAIINKLAAVDVQFAVSADDLIDALSRTGAVAQQAGMNIDELIGMVTAAQQTTARGGAVIGNAFKTIFTRVQRPETLKTLRSLGIAVDDASGKSLAAGKVLQNLARDYDSLSQSAKSMVDQQVAGVFQINILKAAVGDLSKQNSLSSRATQISTSATDQAIRKNEQLNQTIAALATQSGLALEELAKKIGDIALAPGMRDLVQSFKNIVEGISGALDGEGAGSKFAKGLLKGIGNIITGPGLILVGGVFIKLFKDLSVFGVKSLRNLLGLNAAAKQQAALQSGIGQLLAKNVAYEQAMAAAAGNVAKQSAITQSFLAKEVALRQRAAALTGAMAAGMFGAGFRVSGAGTLAAKGGAAARAVKGVPGFAPKGVPNFAARVFNPRVTKAGGTGAGSSPFQFTSSSMLGTSEGYRGTFNLNASKAALAKELPAGLADIVKNSNISGFQMQTRMAGFSPSQQTRMIEQMRDAVSTVPGLSGRAKEALTNAHTRKTSLLEVNAGISSALKSRKITPKERGAYDQHMSEKVTERSFNRAFGTVGTGGRQGADYAIDAVRFRGGRTDPMELKKLAGFTTGDATTIASAMKKQLVSGTNPALRNRLREEAQAQNKLPQFERAMLERYAQEYRSYVINNRGLGGIANRGGTNTYFNELTRDQLVKSNLSNLSPAQQRHIQDEVLRYNRQVLNFAPIGDAIQREKMQVGGLLGMNPSQVQTRVIQNTSLKSSFNPQGFGVISPTIGQRSFSDAKRMHRGENLKTANLPNFAGLNLPKAGDLSNVLEVSGQKPIPTILSQIDPVAQRKITDSMFRGTQQARLDIAFQRALDQADRKARAKAADIMPKGGPATFVGGGGGGGGATGASARRGVMPFIKSVGGGAAAAGRGAMGMAGGAMGMAGAALMHPVAQIAMMAPFLHNMARGFADTPTPQERFFQTPEQRRRGGRGQARFDAAAAGVIPGAKMGGALAAGGSIVMDAASLLGFAPQLGPFGKVRAATGAARLGMRAKSFFGAGARGLGRGVGAAGSMSARAVKLGAFGGVAGGAFGYGRGFFSGAQGRGFLSPEEFAQGSQFLGERGTEQVGQMTSIRDNLQIAGDSQRTAVDRFAANTAIQQTLNQIDDKDARVKLSKVLGDDSLSRAEKSRQVLRIQTEAAEIHQKRTGIRSGVQGMGGALTAQTTPGASLASSGMASMLLASPMVGQKVMNDFRTVAKRRTEGDLISSAENIDFEAIEKSFSEGGWTGDIKELFTEELEGRSKLDMEDYIKSVEKLAGNFKHNKDLQHQIFSAMLVDEEIFKQGAVDMEKVNKIIEDAVAKASASQAIVKPSQTEINNFQKLLDARRALENRLFQADLTRTAGINAGARGVTAGTGSINAMMGAGLMTTETGQRRAGRLERAQFERSAAARRAGIFDQASLSMGSIFGDGPTPETMAFDKHLRGIVEGGDFTRAIKTLKNLEVGDRFAAGPDNKLRVGVDKGTADLVAEKELIREQIKLLEARHIQSEDAKKHTKAQRENMEMRLRITQDIARMNQPGVRAGNAMNLSMAQMTAAGTIAQAQEARAANQVGRNAMLTPFMTVNQQRDINLQSQLRNIGFQKAQVQRASKQDALGLAGGWLNRFSDVSANMREDARRRFKGGGSGMLALRDKKLGEADRIEAAQTAFSRGIENLIGSEGGATVKGIEELSQTFYDSIGNINSPEAQNAKTQFTKLMTQLKEIAQSEDITIGDLLDAESTAKQSRAMATLKDVTTDFRDAFASAMQSVSTGSASASDALRNFGIAFFGAINARAIGNIADTVSQGLFDWGSTKVGKKPGGQKGGLISAQNGMYISGGRTGDKNPALLEDGEYVLNRNAVKAMGGPESLNAINFAVAPRFRSGGKLMSPISASGVPKKSLDKILAEYESPATIMDPRLSGFAHANDPTLQNVRGDIRDWHNEQIQKKFEKQAKKDQLVQTIASAAISAGISGAIGKFSEIGGADKLAKDRGFDSYRDMVKDPEFAGELKAMGLQRTAFGYNLKNFGSNLGSRRQAGHGWGGFGGVGASGSRFGSNMQIQAAVNPQGGWSYKKGSWGRNEQRGGYIDNIPAMLTGGEFVMSSSAVRRHGSGFLNRLNRGGRVGYQQGGLVGDQGVVPAENNVSQQTNTSERTNSNTTINITVNSGGEQGEQSSEGQPGTKEKELATKIRGAVLSVLKEEKRTGGTLRDVTSET